MNNCTEFVSENGIGDLPEKRTEVPKSYTKNVMTLNLK